LSWFYPGHFDYTTQCLVQLDRCLGVAVAAWGAFPIGEEACNCRNGQYLVFCGIMKHVGVVYVGGLFRAFYPTPLKLPSSSLASGSSSSFCYLCCAILASAPQLCSFLSCYHTSAFLGGFSSSPLARQALTLHPTTVSITPIKEADVVRHLEGRLIRLLLSKEHHYKLSFTLSYGTTRKWHKRR